MRRVAADAAHQHLVAAGGFQRGGIQAVAGSSITRRPGAEASSWRHSSGDSGERVCTLADTEWPVNTGT